MTEIIFFLISFILCVGGCICCPKVKKMNAVVGIMLGYVTTMCFGSVGVLVLSFFQIDVTLTSSAFIYSVFALLLWGYIIYKHEVQKLEIRLCDFIGLVVGFIVVATVALVVFTPYLHINHTNLVDSSSHYIYAMKIVRSHKVSGMYFSQYHNAMILSILLPFLPEAWSYKAFILTDCFQTLIEYYFMYAFMIYLFRNRKNKYMPILITVLYWLGYPLYSFVGGSYVYWAMGGMLVLYVIWLLDIYHKNDNLRRICLTLTLLGCFSVTICYVQFTPAVVLSVILVLLNSSAIGLRFQKKYLKQYLIVLLVGVLIAGFAYYNVFFSKGLDIFAALRDGRNTSKSLEIIVMIPVIYYLVWQKIRKKEYDAYVLSLISMLIVQIGLTILATINMVSSYYLFKEYYIFWILMFIIFVKEFSSVSKKVRTCLGHYFVLACIFLLFAYTPKSEMITDEIYSLDNSIYRYNAVMFKENKYRDTRTEDYYLTLYEYIAENYSSEDEKIAMIGTNHEKGLCAWYGGITNQPYYFRSPFAAEYVEDYIAKKDIDYILVVYESDAYIYGSEYFEKFEKVYETEYGFIGKVDK